MDALVEVPKKVQEQLDAFAAALGKVEAAVDALTGAVPPEVERQLPPLRRAEVHIAGARLMHTLFSMYLRVCGEDPTSHQDLCKDWERIEIRVRRLHAAAEDDFLVRNRPAQALDVPAANRFLAHALSGLNQEQRERLRRGEVAGQGEARQDEQEQGRAPRTAGDAADELLASLRDGGGAGLAEEGGVDARDGEAEGGEGDGEVGKGAEGRKGHRSKKRESAEGGKAKAKKHKSRH